MSCGVLALSNFSCLLTGQPCWSPAGRLALAISVRTCIDLYVDVLKLFDMPQPAREVLDGRYLNARYSQVRYRMRRRRSSRSKMTPVFQACADANTTGGGTEELGAEHPSTPNLHLWSPRSPSPHSRRCQRQLSARAGRRARSRPSSHRPTTAARRREGLGVTGYRGAAMCGAPGVPADHHLVVRANGGATRDAHRAVRRPAISPKQCFQAERNADGAQPKSIWANAGLDFRGCRR